MDVFITELSTKRKLQLPSLPEKIKLSASTQYASYDILDLGEVRLPNGTAPKEASWDGVFYGAERKDDANLIRCWSDPLTVCTLLESWRVSGAALKLVIAGSPINIDVTISQFEYELYGGFGDYAYAISFIESDSSTVTVDKAKKSTNRPSTPSTTTKTYTIVSGDRLWNLAQKDYGSGAQYTKIYNANKSIIESTAKRHGHKSSNNGYWIFPGTVLTIP